METHMLIGGIALCAAFGCALALSVLASAAARRRTAAMMAQGSGPASLSGLIAWRLRNGFQFALPLAEMLLGFERVKAVADEAAAVLGARGLATTPESVCSVAVVSGGLLGLAAGLATGSVIGAVATAGCLLAFASAYVGHARDRRREEARDAVPEALESMAACFGSGFTLLQTFQQVAAEVQGPLGDTFARSAHTLEMGGSAQMALNELRTGAYASELSFVAVALDVQHQSGGAMRQVLDAASDTVKGELALRRSLRVQTAQAKLSARVVAIMPLVLVAAFSLATPDFLMPFFESPFGYALLAVAVVMQLAGIVLVRRALSVDGVS